MKKMNSIVLALAVALPALVLGASDDAAKTFKKSCSLCHGVKGDGQGLAGKKMKPPATDFTKADEMARHTDEQLADVIKFGGKAAKMKVDMKMPAFGKFTDEQVKGLVGVVRGFAKSRPEARNPGEKKDKGDPVK